MKNKEKWKDTEKDTEKYKETAKDEETEKDEGTEIDEDTEIETKTSDREGESGQLLQMVNDRWRRCRRMKTNLISVTFNLFSASLHSVSGASFELFVKHDDSSCAVRLSLSINVFCCSL